jgi:hypothetical protein
MMSHDYILANLHNNDVEKVVEIVENHIHRCVNGECNRSCCGANDATMCRCGIYADLMNASALVILRLYHSPRVVITGDYLITVLIYKIKNENLADIQLLSIALPDVVNNYACDVVLALASVQSADVLHAVVDNVDVLDHLSMNPTTSELLQSLLSDNSYVSMYLKFHVFMKAR